jgi:hypothetical protein
VGKNSAPFGFSEGVAARVCGLISEGYGLRKIEREPGMPTKAAILSWLLQGEAARHDRKSNRPLGRQMSLAREKLQRRRDASRVA